MTTGKQEPTAKKMMSTKFKQAISALSVLALCSLGTATQIGAAPATTSLTQAAIDQAETDGVADSLSLEKALSVAENIEDTDYKSFTLAGIATAYAQKGEFARASELLAQALQGLAQGSESNRSKGLNRIAVGYVAIEEKEKAAELLLRSQAAIGEIRSRSPNYNDFLEIIQLYATFGDAVLAEPGLKRATELADEIGDNFRQSYALEKIAIAYAQLGAQSDQPQSDQTQLDQTRAEQSRAIADTGITHMHQRLQAISDSSDGRAQLVRQTSTGIAIAEARARMGDTEAAIALLQSLPLVESAHSLVEVATVYTHLEDQALARSALDALAPRVEDISDVDERTVDERIEAIYGMVFAYAEIGEVQAAQDFLDATVPDPSALYPAGTETDTSAFVNVSKLANMYERLGRVETQQALLRRTFELYAPEALPEPNQLEAWQALLFGLAGENYARIADEQAPDVRASLLHIATKNNWDCTFQAYLAELAQAERARGELALVQQRLERATTLLARYEYGTSRARCRGLLNTLTTLTFVYAEMPEGAVKEAGLRSLTQAAERMAYSEAQQRLLSAIALAYGSTPSHEPRSMRIWN